MANGRLPRLATSLKRLVYYSYNSLAVLYLMPFMFGTKYPALRHSERTTQFYSPYNTEMPVFYLEFVLRIWSKLIVPSLQLLYPFTSPLPSGLYLVSHTPRNLITTITTSYHMYGCHCHHGYLCFHQSSLA
jgi:hypothetical protein